MNDRTFPRWSAPILGSIVGAGLGLRIGLEPNTPLAMGLVIGAVLGALAGCLIFLLDSPDPLLVIPGSQPSSLVGRTLALIGCGLFWVPVIGFAFSVAAWVLNRKCHDWTKTCTRIGLVLGGLVTIFIIFYALFS